MVDKGVGAITRDLAVLGSGVAESRRESRQVARATEVRWGEDIDYVASVGDDVVNDDGLPDRLTSIVNAGLKY